MTTEQIQSFLMAAQLLSFTKASEQLFITQSALSRQIIALEKELNVTLFIRRNNTVELTGVGKTLQTGLIDIYADLVTLREQVEDVAQGLEGRLSIGVLADQTVDEPVTDAVQALAKRGPGVKLILTRMDYAEINTGLLDGTIDVAVTVFRENATFPDPSITHLVYAQERVFLAIHENLMPPQGVYQEEMSLNEILKILPVAMVHPENFGESLTQNCWGSLDPELKLDYRCGYLHLLVTSGLYAMPANESCFVHFVPHMTKLPIRGTPTMLKGLIWNRNNENPLLQLFLESVQSHTA
ncbi:MAG: hypothetical protein H6Q60_235 [Oscillospiraceae bacterium]|nr:hypothetical protein [Oscillospiraceae bacterium]